MTGVDTPNGFKFSLIPPPEGVLGPQVLSVYVDSNGTVWYGCGNSLCRIEDRSGRLAASVFGNDAGLPSEQWDAILGDWKGNLWVRSERSLYILPTGAHRFQPGGDVPESKNIYPVLSLDPSGRLLVPTFRGLARQTDRGWETIDAQDGLTTNDISAVTLDREGSIWLGLLGSGLARWRGFI